MKYSINIGKNKYIKGSPFTNIDKNGDTILNFESSDLYIEWDDCNIKKGDIVKINNKGDRYRYTRLNKAFGVTEEDNSSEIKNGCCAYVENVVYNFVNKVVTAILKSKGRTYILSVHNLSVVMRLGDSFLNYNRLLGQFCVEKYNGISPCGNILSSAKNDRTVSILVCTKAVPLVCFDFKKTNEENLKNIIEWC